MVLYKHSTISFSRQIQSIRVTLSIQGMVLLQHLLRFSNDYFQLFNGTGILYELIALKMCLLESLP